MQYGNNRLCYFQRVYLTILRVGARAMSVENYLNQTISDRLPIYTECRWWDIAELTVHKQSITAARWSRVRLYFLTAWLPTQSLRAGRLAGRLAISKGRIITQHGEASPLKVICYLDSTSLPLYSYRPIRVWYSHCECDRPRRRDSSPWDEALRRRVWSAYVRQSYCCQLVRIATFRESGYSEDFCHIWAHSPPHFIIIQVYSPYCSVFAESCSHGVGSIALTVRTVRRPVAFIVFER